MLQYFWLYGHALYISPQKHSCHGLSFRVGCCFLFYLVSSLLMCPVLCFTSALCPFLDLVLVSFVYQSLFLLVSLFCFPHVNLLCVTRVPAQCFFGLWFIWFFCIFVRHWFLDFQLPVLLPFLFAFCTFCISYVDLYLFITACFLFSVLTDSWVFYVWVLTIFASNFTNVTTMCQNQILQYFDQISRYWNCDNIVGTLTKY